MHAVVFKYLKLAFTQQDACPAQSRLHTPSHPSSSHDRPQDRTHDAGIHGNATHITCTACTDTCGMRTVDRCQPCTFMFPCSQSALVTALTSPSATLASAQSHLTSTLFSTPHDRILLDMLLRDRMHDMVCDGVTWEEGTSAVRLWDITCWAATQVRTNTCMPRGMSWIVAGCCYVASIDWSCT